MQMRVLVGLALALALGIGLGSARADNEGIGSGDPFTLNFDENGNGMVSVNGGLFMPLQGALAPDPSQASHPMVLTYPLPELVTNGDEQIFEGAVTSGVLSDVLRFTDASGNLATGLKTADRMIYYSDRPERGERGDLADTGFPGSSPGTLFATPIAEVGAEGSNGFQFAPNGAAGNVYNGISDAPVPDAPAPEPGSILLFGMGAVGLAGYAWRRKQMA